jgi:chromosome segregation ATPase
MLKNLTPLFVITLLGFMPAASIKAGDQASPAELHLREAVRNTMLQLRDAQNQLATLQATQAENELKIKTLSDQADALVKQSVIDKDTADKKIATLSAKSAAQEAEITRLKLSLEKWKTGYRQAAVFAKAKEAERSKLAARVILLQRRSDDLEAKNAELFKTGSEILTRYEKFSLGNALAAKEPFVGITRVKLENQVQDYHDKLLDHKYNPESVPSPSPEPSQSPAPKAGAKSEIPAKPGD